MTRPYGESDLGRHVRFDEGAPETDHEMGLRHRSMAKACGNRLPKSKAARQRSTLPDLSVPDLRISPLCVLCDLCGYERVKPHSLIGAALESFQCLRRDGERTAVTRPFGESDLGRHVRPS